MPQGIFGNLRQVREIPFIDVPEGQQQVATVCGYGRRSETPEKKCRCSSVEEGGTSEGCLQPEMAVEGQGTE